MLIVEGNGSRDQIGRNAIFRGEIEDCIHQNHLIRVRVDRSIADPEFVSHYLNSNVGKAQMTEKAQTTTGLHTLSVSKVEQLVIPIPPLEIQQSTLARLMEETSKAEQAHIALKSQINSINALPTALLRRAFSGEL